MGDRPIADVNGVAPRMKRPAEARPLASSPCSMAEADAAYAGYMTRQELTDFLNMLLEAQRAGMKVTAMLVADPAAPPAQAEQLREMSKAEARFCAMLTDQVQRLGGAPSLETGAFEGKMRAISGFRERLALLDAGIHWVIRKLADALPRIREDDIHRDLRTMLEVHEHCRAVCRSLLGAQGEG